jgi:hypothetical protein
MYNFNHQSFHRRLWDSPFPHIRLRIGFYYRSDGNHLNNGFRNLLNGFNDWKRRDSIRCFHHGLPGSLASCGNSLLEPNVLKLLQSRALRPTERGRSQHSGPFGFADLRSHVLRHDSPIDQPPIKLA